MATAGYVQVLSKSNLREQTVLEASLASGELNPSSVRVRPELLSLTANNLTYANLGSILNWWSTWPVPKSLPEPYNDEFQYGICPSWGYARVQATNVDGIAEDDLIWGYWLFSSSSVDLSLEKTSTRNQFIETSPWRQKLMPLYNVYLVVPPESPAHPSGADSKALRQWTASLFAIWQSGYMLNSFVFSKTHHIHPVPEAGLPWSIEDADLSEALVITLASSGKTARSFAHQLATNRPQGEGPIALLEVGSGSVLTNMQNIHLEHHSVSYEEMLAEPTLSWIRSYHMRRAVLVDFGGRNGAAEKIFTKLKELALPNGVTVIGVAGEAKVLGPADWGEIMKTTQRLGLVQSNASGQRSAAIEKLGAERVFGDSDREFQRVVRETKDAEGRVLGVKMVVGKGVKGEDGIEGGWRRICDGSVGGAEGLVYEV